MPIYCKGIFWPHLWCFSPLPPSPLKISFPFNFYFLMYFFLFREGGGERELRKQPEYIPLMYCCLLHHSWLFTFAFQNKSEADNSQILESWIIVLAEMYVCKEELKFQIDFVKIFIYFMGLLHLKNVNIWYFSFSLKYEISPTKVI